MVVVFLLGGKVVTGGRSLVLLTGLLSLSFLTSGPLVVDVWCTKIMDSSLVVLGVTVVVVVDVLVLVISSFLQVTLTVAFDGEDKTERFVQSWSMIFGFGLNCLARC